MRAGLARAWRGGGGWGGGGGGGRGGGRTCGGEAGDTGSHMSFSLNSLKEGYIGDCYRGY